MISTVIFDLDGLLADTEGLHFQSYHEALKQHGVDVTLEQYIEHWIRGGKGVTDWAREHGLVLDVSLIRKQKYARYQELVALSVQPMQGAVELLKRLHNKRHLALASASHGNSVEWVLRCLGITHYFEDVLSGDDVKRSKPFPDIFLKSAQNLKIDPAECVVLEDAERGIRAANSAGMKCIAIPNVYTQDNDFSLATKVVSSLDEVTLDLMNSL